MRSLPPTGPSIGSARAIITKQTPCRVNGFDVVEALPFVPGAFILYAFLLGAFLLGAFEESSHTRGTVDPPPNDAPRGEGKFRGGAGVVKSQRFLERGYMTREAGRHDDVLDGFITPDHARDDYGVLLEAVDDGY